MLVVDPAPRSSSSSPSSLACRTNTNAYTDTRLYLGPLYITIPTPPVSELERGVACTGKDGGGAQHHPIFSYAGDIYTLFLTAHITKNATTQKNTMMAARQRGFSPLVVQWERAKQNKEKKNFLSYLHNLFVFLFYFLRRYSRTNILKCHFICLQNFCPYLYIADCEVICKYALVRDVPTTSLLSDVVRSFFSSKKNKTNYFRVAFREILNSLACGPPDQK